MAKKINRRPFSEIYGYDRDSETSEQTAKRLLTRRLNQLVKIAGSVAKMGKTPYKLSEAQKEYVVEISSNVVDDIISAMRIVEDRENTIQVPE